MDVIGIDPSQRHTGLCLLKGMQGLPIFMEIKTEGMPILESANYLDDLIWKFLLANSVSQKHVVFGMERQLTSGFTAPLQFYMQMVVLSTLESFMTDMPTKDKPKMVMPLPIQLKSYISKRHGIGIVNKSDIVRGYKKLTGLEGRISSHLAEAYLLCRMVRDVIEGKWEYKLPAEKMPLFSWKIINKMETPNERENTGRIGSDATKVGGVDTGNSIG